MLFFRNIPERVAPDLRRSINGSVASIAGAARFMISTHARQVAGLLTQHL
jgi:hypothetical protein